MRKWTRAFPGTLVLAVALGVVVAASLPVSLQAENLITIQASNGDKTGSWTWVDEIVGDPFVKTDILLEGAEIWSDDGTTILGKVDQLSIFLKEDPVVSLGFAVTAPNFNVNYTITSVTLGFAPIANPAATASASVNVTDNNGAVGSVVGAYLGNTKSYEARTNVGVFANLVDNVAVVFPTISAGKQQGPVPGVIAGNVSSMTTEFKFSLTAGDQASGTSVFWIVPEPGSLMVLAGGLTGLAGLVIRRKKA